MASAAIAQVLNMAAVNPDVSAINECVTFAACCAAVPGMYVKVEGEGAEAAEYKATEFTKSMLGLFGANEETPTNKIAINDYDIYNEWISGLCVYPEGATDGETEQQQWRYRHRHNFLRRSGARLQ